MTAPYDRIARSADCFLFDLDAQQRSGTVLHVDRAFFRDAAFLDQRAVAERRYGGWRIQLDALARALEAVAPSAQAPRFIFHIGHCGSTLISRVLDGLPTVLGLREPLALLQLAGAFCASPAPHGERLVADLPLVVRMLERGIDPADRVIIKATSIASCLAPELLSRRPASRALLLAIRLPDYLATYLRDAALRESARADAGLRLARYRTRVDDDGMSVAALSDAECIGLNWLIELAGFARLLDQPDTTDRVALLDFSTWLGDPATQTAAICRLMELDAGAAQIAGALGDDRLVRYAKDPRQLFDAKTRAAELRNAHAAHREAIDAGIRFVETQLQRHSGKLRVPDGWLTA